MSGPSGLRSRALSTLGEGIYVPGYLAFREGTVIVAAIRKLSIMPHVTIIAGQGIAHPRGFGIASHM